MSQMQSEAPRLRAGLEALGLSLEAERLQALLAYADELLAWNARINLTAVTRPADVVSHHLLDSLAVLPYLSDGPLLDVGSGGGLPGLVLAIVQPDREIVSVDSRNKKIAFQRHAARKLGLSCFRAEAVRIEQWQPPHPFPQIISRAFSSLKDFTDLAGRHLQPGGRMLAMKGRRPGAELNEMNPGWQLVKMPPLEVPGLGAERHLVVLERSETS